MSKSAKHHSTASISHCTGVTIADGVCKAAVSILAVKRPINQSASVALVLEANLHTPFDANLITEGNFNKQTTPVTIIDWLNHSSAEESMII